MNGLSPKDSIAANLFPVVGIVTNQAISKEMGLSAGGSLNLRIDIAVSGVTVAGSIAVKLQHRTQGEAFSDLAGANATSAITADGTVSLTQNVQVAADQPNMPLKKHVRAVLTTTNAGDEVTIEEVLISQEL
jgi:hypothetical protein